MQNDVVADHAILPDGEREAGIGVERRIVLDLRALAELVPFVVAAQHRAEPHTGVELQPHLADQRRVRRDPIAAGFRKFRLLAVELVDHESIPLYGGTDIRRGAALEARARPRFRTSGSIARRSRSPP